MIRTKVDSIYAIQYVNMNKFVNIEKINSMWRENKNILSLSVESCKRGLEASNHYKTS